MPTSSQVRWWGGEQVRVPCYWFRTSRFCEYNWCGIHQSLHQDYQSLHPYNSSISQHILELYFYLGFVGKLLCFFCSPARKPQQSPPPFLHPSGSHLLIILSCLFAYNNTASYLEEKEEKDRPRLPPSQTLSHCDQAPGLKNAEKQ